MVRVLIRTCMFSDTAFDIEDSPPVVPRLQRRGRKFVRFESVVPRADHDQVGLEVLEAVAGMEKGTGCGTSSRERSHGSFYCAGVPAGTSRSQGFG